MWIGSQNCRLHSNIIITFHGDASNDDVIGDGAGTKGIGMCQIYYNTIKHIK